MALINTSLPNLIQGVSQQPDATRFSGQCDEQINFMSSVVDGLTKRNGTRFVGKVLTNAISADSFVHFINRSEEERYVLIHDNTKLRAYNVITGLEAKINGSTGGYTVANTYLDVPSGYQPRQQLKATTVADGTFIVNRGVTVAVDQTVKSDALDKEALIFVKQGDYEKNYALDIEYTSATPAAATLTVRYKKRKSYFGVSEYKLDSVQSVPTAGVGYLNDEIYDIVGYPATYNSEEITVGKGTATVQADVTNTTTGALTSSTTIENYGPYIHVKNTYTDTIDINVTIEVPEGLGSAVPQTKEISVWSETTAHALHADTSRISAIIANGPTNLSTYTDGGTYTAPKGGGSSVINNAAFNDSANFPGIIAGTNSDFSLERHENLIVLTRKTSTQSDFKITARDGLAGGALGVVYKEVGSITDLPVYAKNGFRVKVRGDVDSNADDYYVRFETDSGKTFGIGKWVETVAPGINLQYQEDTLPMLLVNDAEDSFTISHIKTAPRVSGDDYSNPFSSFSDNRIQNSVFFKNRLGFICSNNIILSEAGLGSRNDQGDFEYNFGRTTVTTLLDSAPIDVTIESNRVTNLTAATAVQENLILFADNGQFVLKGEELLTPRTVSVKPVTNFEYNEDTDPVSVGSFIYYPFDFGNHTGIREFSLNKDTDVYESNAITEQVPRYIPKDITRLAGSLSENTLAVLSKEDDQTLYIYKYFYSEGRKVLSSWFKWTFNVHIKNFEFMDSTLYMVATDDITDTETYILNMPLNFDGQDEGLATYVLSGGSSGYAAVTLTESVDDNVTHLDLRTPGIVFGGQIKFPSTFATGTERPLRENITAFNLYTNANTPYYCSSDVAVYTDKGVKLNSTVVQNGSSTYITISESLADGTSVWVGHEYDSKYVFSEQIFKGQAGQARTPNAAAKQFIKNLSLYHTRTSDYQVKVTPDKRSQYINSFPATTDDNDRVELKDGFFRAPVFTSSEGVEISLENNGAFPSNFQSAEFETFIHTRSSRYGA
jgi:hypothetical protein